ncbi:AI-2E family transporter [uncultured Campylobacter sp.]|uniref:AI-2E family transporter n=1 Tax=uncultured Campylobacter sp. TaxID=218934 RepID=UPI0026170046|nr:AI-2E family transporter [uncultured Campylobacter sp.]
MPTPKDNAASCNENLAENVAQNNADNNAKSEAQNFTENQTVNNAEGKIEAAAEAKATIKNKAETAAENRAEIGAKNQSGSGANVGVESGVKAAKANTDADKADAAALGAAEGGTKTAVENQSENRVKTDKASSAGASALNDAVEANETFSANISALSDAAASGAAAGMKAGLAKAGRAKTNKIFFIGATLLMFCCVIYLFSPFLMVIAIGVLMAVATSGLHAKVTKLCRGRRTLASVLSLFLLCALFFVPFIYAVIEIAKNAASFDMARLNDALSYVQSLNIKLPGPFEKFDTQFRSFLANLDVAGLAKQIISYLSVVGKSSAKFIVDMVLIIVFCFFAYLYGESFKRFFKKILPVEPAQIDYIFSETANTMSVVFYSTIFNAVLQGFLFSIIAGIFGFDALLMGVLFAFCSLIPAVGGALIYVPTALYVLAGGSTSGAIVIMAYCVILISTLADSFVKPLVIKFINSRLVENPANINEMLIFFSMLSGISTFGFWGVILGPAILTLFIAVLNLYDYLKKIEFE